MRVMTGRTQRTALAVAVSIVALTPAPGQAQGPATTPITLPEARELMDFPPAARANGFIGATGIKIALLDSGYAGLDEWLKQHPEEAPHTKIISRRPGDTGTHGFGVYRTARSVLADAEIYIYDFENNRSDIPALFEDLKVRGIQVVNASFGMIDYRLDRTGADALTAAMLREAAKHEIFVFTASGNSGAQVHSFDAQPSGTSYLVPELMEPLPTDPAARSDALTAIPLENGRLNLSIFWNAREFKDPPLGIRLALQDGWTVFELTGEGAEQVLATIDAAGARTEARTTMQPGVLKLELSGLPRMAYRLMLDKKTTSAAAVPMRLYAREGTVRGALNGRESGTLITAFENPFIVSVGAMSRAADGKASPASFSSWGTTTQGGAIPHILGPGRLVVDGQTRQGTSHAAPFITSMLVTANGYNPKNILERVSDHSRISPQVPAEERSRWGLPSMIKLAQLRSLVGLTKVENWSHRVEGAALRVDTTFTRCCMEGMTYNPVLELYRLRDGADGGVTAERVIDPTTRRAAFVMLDKRARGKDIEKEPIAFNLPLDKLALEPGRYQLRFGFFIKAWQSSVPYRPHQGGTYEFALN